ncbi:MAG: penicillin-binding protein activator [Deefgea sp.]
MHAKFLLAQSWAAVSWFRATAVLIIILYGALAITTTTAWATDASAVVQVEPQVEPPSQLMALILPSKAKSFKAASDAIRAGVLAGERVHGGAGLPVVRAYPTDDKEENVVAAYQQAVLDGAAVVIGPLTKSAMNFLSDSTELTIPVLALNSFDETTLQQANLYSFSLSVEAEAAQVAQLMLQNQFARPMVLQVNDALSQRMAQGFVQEWRKLNQSEAVVITVADARRDAAQLREQIKDGSVDAIFLAMDGKMARLVRPYVGNDLPIYGTSQIDSSRLGRTALVDLTGIRFVDMPWIAVPDTDGFDLYNRTRSPSSDVERLFAMGIDAWRIAAQLLVNPQNPPAIDGATGVLTIGDDRVIKRSMVTRTMSLNK